MPVYVNSKNLPEAFVKAAGRDVRRYDMTTYSVTELLKGEREVLLARRHDGEIVEDVADCVWRVFGSAVHKVFEEQPRGEHELREVRLKASAGPVGTVTGQFDSFDPDTGELVDWKTAGTWKVAKGDLDDWRTQALAYAWLLYENGHEPRSARFVALLKDHSSSKVGTEGYPDSPVAVVEFPVGREEAYEVGAMLSEKVSRLVGLSGTADDDLPMCSEADRWARPASYSVVRDGATRATRNFGADRAAAEDFAEGKGAGYHVEERGGGDGKCPRFCAAREFCSHWRENYSPDALSWQGGSR